MNLNWNINAGHPQGFAGAARWRSATNAVAPRTRKPGARTPCFCGQRASVIAGDRLDANEPIAAKWSAAQGAVSGHADRRVFGRLLQLVHRLRLEVVRYPGGPDAGPAASASSPSCLGSCSSSLTGWR
jgi:hypothetical protein